MALSDIIAGITVALTAIPQGLALAQIAGIPPVYGLYSSFTGCFVYIIFGSTVAINIGPTSIQSIMTYKYGIGKPPEYAVFLCFVTGAVTTLMGLLRLGFIADFMSSPVINGFTSAVAITIVATQLKSILGIKFDNEGFVPTLEGVAENFGQINQWDAFMSLSCFTLYCFLQSLPKILGCLTKKNQFLEKLVWLISISRSAIIILGATYLVSTKYPGQKEPFSLVGNVPPGLPDFGPPPFSGIDPVTNKTINFIDILYEDGSALLTLPLLGVMQHITIAKAFAGMDRVDYTQEILCIGVSNLVACFFNAYSISGSFSRTTVNAMSGAKSPAGGLVTGIIVVLALQFLTPYFYYIPRASLAALITGYVISMVDLSIMKTLWRSKRMDLIPWSLTLLVALLIGLEFGILIGLVISVLYLVYYAARPRVKVMEGETIKGNPFVIVVLDRSMTFPSVDRITYEITKAVVLWGNKKTPVIIDCRHIQFADYTAGEAIRDMLRGLKDQGHDIVFWKLKPSILRILLGVMYGTGIIFIHCQSESDIEGLIDASSIYKSRVEIKRKSLVAEAVTYFKAARNPESFGPFKPIEE